MSLLLSFLPIALIIFALVDLIRSDESQVKYLPKMGWVLVIVFLPVIGSIVWLVIGKDRGRATENVSFGDPRRQEAVAAASSPRLEMTAEEELAEIEREIEFHENEARIRRLEAQLQAKRDATK